jgi:hypothetical protein
MEDYYTYVEAWLKAESYSWEKFFAEAKLCCGRYWREHDEEGKRAEFDNDDRIDALEFTDDGPALQKEFEARDAQKEVVFERNMRTLYSLPFPGNAILLAARDTEDDGVREVCSVCCTVQARYAKLHDGKKLPLGLARMSAR